MGFIITLADTGESFACPDGEPVLKAMSRLGIRGVPSGCHGGGCGVCKVRVLSGDFAAKKLSRAHVSAEEEADGVTLACRITPRSHLIIKALGKLKERVDTRTYGPIAAVPAAPDTQERNPSWA